MIQILMANWHIILLVILLIGAAVGAVYAFLVLSPEKQKEKVRKWLLGAVITAEREYGGGTGKLKLAVVYDLFLIRFPKLSKLISFATFSVLVDQALEQMRILLETNPKILSFVLKKGAYDE